VFDGCGWIDAVRTSGSNLGVQYLWNDGWTLNPTDVPPDNANPLLNDDFNVETDGDAHMFDLFNLRDKNSTTNDTQCWPGGYAVPIYLCAKSVGIAHNYVQCLQKSATNVTLSDNEQQTWFTVSQSLL
jgi:hypothetical protein